MSQFWSPAIQSLVPYTPGEQPKVDGLIKLNTNENPYPPAPAVEAVLREFDTERLRLYPDPDCHALKQALADEAGLSRDQVFVGNGSDEVLALTFMALLRHEQPLLLPETTYSFYNVYIDLFNIDARHIPLTDDYRIDLDAYSSENGGIIFANPNAPTGVGLTLEQISDLLIRNTHSVVVVDEAYVDFGAESASQLVDRYPNLLVTQTFSKSRSLAGMRVGYAYGHPKLIEALERVKNSFNSYPLDMLAQQTAIAALQDRGYFQHCVQQVMDTREWTCEQLTSLGFEVLPSQTNFVFTSHSEVAAAELMQYLRDNRILVRHFTKPGIDNHLRITIGTPDEMTRLIECLKQHPSL
ncbi:histidinol-phosphate transaminase [Marinobacterium weihaiense]|uniref:Histidinol-phosphate aminotransferase n=1 Tax=Marinobacterium weihaiense TaxID=2851016 RepID=A0ABS6M6U5_9GAMM|nr:histidinol-phosphate transaminase [Marinobacterium weihaiense]MBV0932003.1 histidinol-phosphate transaminase [Marinobacterium weihaiense]